MTMMEKYKGDRGCDFCGRKPKLMKRYYDPKTNIVLCKDCYKSLRGFVGEEAFWFAKQYGCVKPIDNQLMEDLNRVGCTSFFGVDIKDRENEA